MLCSACGTPNDDSATACVACGAALTAPPPTGSAADASAAAHDEPLRLEYRHEAPLFVLSILFSALGWMLLLLMTLGFALIYILLGFVIYLFAHSAFISMLRGSATRITATQFPDLHQRVVDCSARVGLRQTPDAFVLHVGGIFNALAARFLGRNFIVLYSDILDALESQPDAVNFYIGHELGHIKRNHLLWAPILWPSSILPLLGSA